MQLAQHVPMLLLLLALVGQCTSRLLSGGAQLLKLDSGVAQQQLLEQEQTEREDLKYWSVEWGATEGALLKLKALVDEIPSTMSVLQVATSMPRGDVSQNITGNTSRRVQNASTQASVAVNATGKTHRAGSNTRAALRHINLNPKTAADLAPALAMLNGMYEDGKARISSLNAREKQSKQRYAQKEADHKAKLEKLESRCNHTALPAEFCRNETRDENRHFKYWTGVRERQHRQFHTSLKIQHGMMQKVKGMIDMYNKAMHGTAAQKQQVKQELTHVTGGGTPEVVLFQTMRHEVATFCNEALEEVHHELQTLRTSHTLHTGRVEAIK